jgi:hypothetical protein
VWLCEQYANPEALDSACFFRCADDGHCKRAIMWLQARNPAGARDPPPGEAKGQFGVVIHTCRMW